MNTETKTNNNPKNAEDNSKKCNCNDQFKTQPCPVHFNQKKELNCVIVTDSDMVQEEIRQWVGYTYICPKCKEASILDFMKFCGNCGVEISLQSVKLTNFINELSKRGKWR